MTLRNWQQRGLDTVISPAIENCDKTGVHTVVTMSACVGSGKTNVMFETFHRYIAGHSNERTFHIFVAPRIALCQQQLQSYIEDYGPFIQKNDIEVIEWNCKANEHINVVRRDLVAKNKPVGLLTAISGDSLDECLNAVDNTDAKHFVLFIVDASLWGVESSLKCSRYKSKTLPFLKRVRDRDIKLGVIVYDEAHNYANSQKYMFGQQYALEA